MYYGTNIRNCESYFMPTALQGSIWVMGVVFILAGANHFINPRTYIAIMPPYIPYHRTMVYVSGVFEILGGVGVLFSQTRTWAGIGLILLMLAVFPANIHMALNTKRYHKIPAWVLYVRLPMQFVIIAWIWWTTLR